MTSKLNREFARLGLVRLSRVEKALRIDREVVSYLLAHRQLQATEFEWHGRKWRGIPAKDIEDVEVVRRGGGFVVERRASQS